LKSLPEGWQLWSNPGEDPLTREALFAVVERCTGLLTVGDEVDAKLLAKAPHLRVVCQYGVGVDNIDLDAARERGIVVANLPDEVTYSTAELAMTLLLCCARRVTEADRWIRQHNPFPWKPTLFIGSGLREKTLGLIGFGRIGQLVAGMAKAFQMRVIYTARRRKVEPETRLDASFVSLRDLLRVADAVSLHVPGGPETHHLIGRSELQLMRTKAILVNTSRGSVIEEEALLEALASGRLGAAGLDVFENEPLVTPELLHLENVILTPHLGTSALETRQQMTIRAIATIVAALAGDHLANRIV
jgi:glyoxylate reductase